MSIAVASNFAPSFDPPPFSSQILSRHTPLDLRRQFATLPSTAQIVSHELTRNAVKRSLIAAIPDFNLELSTFITNVSRQIEARDMVGYTIEADVYKDVDLIVNLLGNLIEDTFKIEEVSLNTNFSNETAESDFIASTLLAAIELSKEVFLRMPDIEFDLKVSFQSLPLEISRMLQRRQFAYRIMVIERATGYKFNLPSEILAKDVENVAFIYQAIINRSFIFPFSSVTYPNVPATQENLEQFTELSTKSFIVFADSKPIKRTILGKDISLGEGSFVIQNAAIDDWEKVKEELSRADNHPVEIVIRSLSGQAEYDLPLAPKLPRAAWTSFVQTLIDLDAGLDKRLVERYHHLAAATLNGFSDEEKQIAVERPDLEIEVY